LSARSLNCLAGRSIAEQRIKHRRIIQDGLSETIRFLDRPGRRVLVIGSQVRPINCAFDQMRMQPGPLWHEPPQPCEPVPNRQADAAASGTDALLAAALKSYANAELIRPSEVYCDQGCPVVSADLAVYGPWSLHGRWFIANGTKGTRGYRSILVNRIGKWGSGASRLCGARSRGWRGRLRQSPWLPISRKLGSLALGNRPRSSDVRECFPGPPRSN
jgi:SGNH domain (fused to AT3 domains)